MHINSRVNVRHLFGKLDDKLVHLLRSLTPEEWQLPTVAKKWAVKDVAAHLLDGNIRLLSQQRDGFMGEAAPAGNYNELVQWLNELNASWVTASKRIAPAVMILLHEATGPQATKYYEMAEPDEEAIFPVSWAGETTSANWFHIAREYTEKWIHQQQIREAVNKPGILNEEYFIPFMDTLVLGLPHTFRKTKAPEDTLVQLHLTGDVDHNWYMQREENEWRVVKEPNGRPAALVHMPADVAWKLFSKSLRPSEVKKEVVIEGNDAYGQQLLELVAVMA